MRLGQFTPPTPTQVEFCCCVGGVKCALVVSNILLLARYKLLLRIILYDTSDNMQLRNLSLMDELRHYIKWRQHIPHSRDMCP